MDASFAQRGIRLKALLWLLVSLGTMTLNTAWVRPELPVPVVAAAAGPRLDYMLVIVNGEPHIVNRGQVLIVQWGDRLEVRQAVLTPPAAKKPVKVHVYGYKRPSGGRDDSAQVFSTEQLQAKYSEGGRGEVFAAVASAAGQAHGAVFLRVVAPELEFAEVLINGRHQLVRAGEALSLKPSDQLKVARVLTNIPGNTGVRVHMQPATGGGAAAMNFMRGGRVFASIPLKVGP